MPRMTVESLLLPEVADAYGDCQKAGGLFDPASFQRIKEHEPSGAITQSVSYRRSHCQAKAFKEHTGVDISEWQMDLYSLLRAGPPNGMSDQFLMAKILQLTSPEKVPAFEINYPNIFLKNE